MATVNDAEGRDRRAEREALPSLRQRWDGAGHGERLGMLRARVSRVDCGSRDGALRVRLTPEGLGAIAPRNDGKGEIRWPQ